MFDCRCGDPAAQMHELRESVWCWCQRHGRWQHNPSFSLHLTAIMLLDLSATLQGGDARLQC